MVDDVPLQLMDHSRWPQQLNGPNKHKNDQNSVQFANIELKIGVILAVSNPHVIRDVFKLCHQLLELTLSVSKKIS